MEKPERRAGALERAANAFARGAKDALKTSWFLVKVIVPVTLVVALLDWSGALRVVAKHLSPAMGLLGLPGEATLALISGALLGNYSAIAVAGSLTLNLREMTVLAFMCLTAHNLLVETAVMRKSGSSGLKMAALRLVSSFAMGLILNLVLPESLAGKTFSVAVSGVRLEFLGMMITWLASTAKFILKIALLVLIIMIAQRLLEEFRAMDFLSKAFAPLMRVFGLPRQASFLWIVINVVGYAYGAGIIVEQIESGKMKPQDGDLFNHHASVCHSLLEDSALYAALGLPILWITLPRLGLAVAVVWLERLRRHFVRRSFRVGIN